MINVNNLTFSYPGSSFRLSIPELAIEQGERMAIIGPSGFGKTTLLNLIAGILIHQTGDLEINGQLMGQLGDPQRRNFRIRNIGFVFQDFRLVEYLDVLDNVLFPFRINSHLTLNQERKDGALQLLDSLKIRDKAHRYPAKLSHGERQRVAICRALVNDPSILLADEPTGNLDPENKQHIMDILFNYSSERNASLLVVTHDHNLLTGFERIVDFASFHSTEDES